ncbi:MAG: putative Transcriptional regulator, TetR family [Mycobacterium sp.]|nr:putative Transcriptional regulator, TetR family [Mycobacterium sp.]
MRYSMYAIPMVSGTVGTVTSSTDVQDGRSTRWEEHRRTRRAELVDAALAAIRRHGAGVGMDEIAALAGTSKTVLYRHFADKGDLYLAVCASVDALISTQLRAAMAKAGHPRDMISASIGTYLTIVEADPEVYRFVVQRPSLDRPVEADPVSGLTNAIGDQVAAALEEQLRAAGRDTSAAGPWGHGLVGLVRAATDHWLGQPSRMDREALADHLTQLTWAALADVLAPTSLDIEAPGAPAPHPTQEMDR